MFATALDEDAVESVRPLARIDDDHANLTTRARSYLHANCAHCHRPGGVRGNFDARFETPLANQNILGGSLHAHKIVPDARVVVPGNPARSMILHRLMHHEFRMPPLSVTQRDTEAIGVLTAWIDSLAPPASDQSDEQMERMLALP